MANKKPIKKQGVLLKEEVGYEVQFENKKNGEDKKDNGKKKKN